MKDGLSVASLPSPVERYQLGTKLGSGIFGSVYKATDTQAAGKSVAIKVQTYTDENETHIQEEYKILRDFTKHPNLIDFYGVFCEKTEWARDVWFVLEVNQFCLLAAVLFISHLGTDTVLGCLFSVVRMWVCHRHCQKTKRGRQKNVRGTHRLCPQIYDQGKTIFDWL